MVRPRASTYLQLVAMARQETLGPEISDSVIDQLDVTFDTTADEENPPSTPVLEVLRSPRRPKVVIRDSIRTHHPPARMEDHPAFRNEPSYFSPEIELPAWHATGSEPSEAHRTGSVVTLGSRDSFAVSRLANGSTDVLIGGISDLPRGWTNTGVHVPLHFPPPIPNRQRTPHYVFLCIDLNARRGENWKGSQWCLRSLALLIVGAGLFVLFGM
jgi:hypothetical protein